MAALMGRGGGEAGSGADAASWSSIARCRPAWRPRELALSKRLNHDRRFSTRPLHDAHAALGAKMVPYAGYEMPVQYPGGILAEHQAVRTGLGVFDVSHMGEFEVTGPDRNAFVNRFTCNDISVLDSGDVQYSAILSARGRSLTTAPFTGSTTRS